MSADVLSGLTPEQREAVLHREGPLLILAGAGSGKTRVVTRRIARLVQTGARPSSIVAITFTNKAAGEMRERVEQLLGLEHEVRRRDKEDEKARRERAPIVSTFHSYAVRILREHAHRIGWRRDFTILDEDDQLALVREAAVAARVDVERYRAHVLAQAIGRAKEKLDDAAWVEHASTDVERAAVKVLPGYRRLQRQRNAMDFEDLVAESVLLLERDAEARESLLARVEFVLVDEYQDTNHAQYRLAKLLAGPRRNLCVCGDPDQSIYGWRGADMRNILEFETEYAGAKVVKLERNYRSTATILEASNHLISRNSERKEKQLLPSGEQGAPIEVKRLLDEELEAEYVARRVEEAISAGTKPGEIAVIFRAGLMGKRYEDALLRRNVPCQTSGTASYFERAEVKDALAWVRLAVNPADDLAALRALRSGTRGAGKVTLEKVHDLQRRAGISIVEACGRAAELPTLTRGTRDGLLGFAALARDLQREASTGTVAQVVTSALHRTGIEAALRAGDESDRARADNLKVLADAARDADRRASRRAPSAGNAGADAASGDAGGGGGGGAGAGGAQRTRDFLEKLALRDNQEKDDDERDRVLLTTIHAAKGLEFDVVVVAGLEQGLFPHQRAIDEGALEEERRLAYVAFTRARQKLILCYSGLRAARTSAGERRRPSQFLYELPPALLIEPDRRGPVELPLRAGDPEPESTATSTDGPPAPDAPPPKIDPVAAARARLGLPPLGRAGDAPISGRGPAPAAARTLTRERPSGDKVTADGVVLAAPKTTPGWARGLTKAKR